MKVQLIRFSIPSEPSTFIGIKSLVQVINEHKKEKLPVSAYKLLKKDDDELVALKYEPYFIIKRSKIQALNRIENHLFIILL